MTEQQQQEIKRRAKTDAQALRSGWHARCPYTKVDEAMLWMRELDLELARLKAAA